MHKSTVLLPDSILFFASCQNQHKKKAEPSKPNILFIIADDLGYHDLSCRGSKYYETPHIDRIAAEGMVFTSGYANCQVSSPVYGRVQGYCVFCFSLILCRSFSLADNTGEMDKIQEQGRRNGHC